MARFGPQGTLPGSAFLFNSLNTGREIYCLKFPSHIINRTMSLDRVHTDMLMKNS